MDSQGKREPSEMQVCVLSELCLSSLVSNLERYCAAFKNPNSQSPGWHKEFLTRRFSETLFCRLKDQHQLNCEHLDLLINRHLKELDLVGIDKNLVPHIISRLKTHGTNVISFKGRSQDLEKELYQPLMLSLQNVESVNFSAFMSPEICEAIGNNCPSLKVLKFRANDTFNVEKYNSGILFVLRSCPLLETLQYIDSIGALHTVDKPACLPLLPKKNPFSESEQCFLTSLSSVNRSYSLSDALRTCTTICPYVTDIDIDHLKSDEEIQNLLNFTFLESVKFDKISGISRDTFDKFLKLKGDKISNLDMHYASSVSIRTLIDSCPRLQSLTLHDFEPHYFVENMEELSESALPHLRTLELRKFDFRNQYACACFRLILAMASKLRKITLCFTTGLTSEFVCSLGLYQIRELDICFSDIEVQSLSELVTRGNLQRLNIKECYNIKKDDYLTLTRCASAEGRNGVVIKWSLCLYYPRV